MTRVPYFIGGVNFILAGDDEAGWDIEMDGHVLTHVPTFQEAYELCNAVVDKGDSDDGGPDADD